MLFQLALAAGLLGYALTLIALVAESRRWTAILTLTGTLVSGGTAWWARHLYNVRWGIIWHEHIRVSVFQNDPISDNFWVVNVGASVMTLIGIYCIFRGILTWWVIPAVQSSFQKIRKNGLSAVAI